MDSSGAVRLACTSDSIKPPVPILIRTHLTMKFSALSLLLLTSIPVAATDPTPTVLFDGSSLDAWEFSEGGWVIDKDHSMTCRMEEVKQKNGSVKVRGKGYIWTRKSYEDFELTLSYKLS